VLIDHGFWRFDSTKLKYLYSASEQFIDVIGY